MARADCLPAAFDSVGLEYALGALGWIIAARGLELLFQTIDVRYVDRPVPKHDVGSQGECTLKSLDHGEAETITSATARTLSLQSRAMSRAAMRKAGNKREA
jgi:hypothetical protein